LFSFGSTVAAVYYIRLRAIALALRVLRPRAIALALRVLRLRAIALVLHVLRPRAIALALRGPPTVSNRQTVGGHRPPPTMILSVWQHAANFRRIRSGGDDGLAQFSFSSRSLFRQDMTGKRMPALDFSARSNFEALGRASMCF